MKIVAKTYLSKEKYAEFNRIHQRVVNPRKMRFSLILSAVALSIAFIGLRLSPFGMISAIANGNLASFGDSLMSCGIILFLSLLLCLIVCSAEVAPRFFKEQDCICEFSEERITETVTNRAKPKVKKFAYSHVKRLVDKNGLIIIYVSSFSGIVIDKNGFVEGSAEELKEFLKSKVPFLKIIE